MKKLSKFLWDVLFRKIFHAIPIAIGTQNNAKENHCVFANFAALRETKFRRFQLLLNCLFVVNLVSFSQQTKSKNFLTETKAQKEERMKWWKDARFGLFIHWGLYSVPAGEWKGDTSHAEWIRTTAQIPIHEYEKFVQQFNPVKFNAEDWVKLAKAAGMRYIVITSKHHDGFCMFNTKQTDFDIMSTPFRRDVMKELSAACKKEGIQLCFYHSIMDWHHPDYLPRREWEKDRPITGANLSNYISYMKNELKELLTNYGKIGVLWFDGEWENTWTHEKGKDLYQYVRSLQPSIIINNRVDVGREGMQGLTKEGEFVGDFGTPEQEIPATGIPGIDWESCMTMNNNWGYNSHDNNWKSSEDLVRKLIDIASKGGNFLLNIGPTSEGVFPDPAIDRLKDIGSWMSVNHESIYQTKASPFKILSWGRCTQKPIAGGTRLYLHIFDWPADGKLMVPGLGSQVTNCYSLSDKKKLKAEKTEGNYIIDMLKAKCFLKDKPITETSVSSFQKVTPTPSVDISSPIPGLNCSVYEGEWSNLPDFNSLRPTSSGVSKGIDISSKKGTNKYGFVFDGFIQVPRDGVYNFYISSDDGSELFIDGNGLIDNDGLHGMVEKNQQTALAKGFHSIKILFFQKSGGDDLQVAWEGPGFKKITIPASVFFRAGY